MSHLGPTLRRRRRPASLATSSRAGRLLAAAVISLLVNAFLLLRLDLSWLDKVSAPKRAVSMAALTARDWEQNRAVGAPQKVVPLPPRTPTPPPAPPPPDEPKGQVVRVAPPPTPPKEPPKDAKYLSEHDSVVEKETKSRFADNGLGRPAPVPSSPVKPEPLRGPRGRPDAGEPPRAEAKPPEEARKLAFDWRPGAAVRREAQRTPPQAASAAPAPLPGPAAEKGLPGADGSDRVPDLRPSAAAYQSLAGGPANDHLPDVEEGEGTFLNTREWRYAGYFNLITERVDEQWVTAGRKEVEQRDPSGQRFLYKDRLAVLDVTLDDRGSVRNVRVVRSTGVDFLDRVAIDMFRRAETFANPPKGIIDSRGQINFAFGINFVGVSPSMGLLRRPTFRD